MSGDLHADEADVPAPSSGADRDGGSSDTLAIVALAMGIAALVMSAIPFYGMMTALPLGVVALVIGVLARRRTSSRGLATAGAVTGGLAVTVVVVWIAVMFLPLRGFGSEIGVRTTAESETVHAPAPDIEDAEPPAHDPPPVEVDPGGSDLAPGALEDATGEVELELDGEQRTFELTGCAIGQTAAGHSLRGHGPDGGILVRVGDTVGPGANVLVVIEDGDHPTRVLLGGQRGGSQSERSTVIDRRRFELEGGLRDALDDAPLEIRLVATCS